MKQKHIHKYIRVNGKHTKIFKCAHLHCNFFIHQATFEILIGRVSLCNGCNNEFIMTEDSLTEDTPTCITCKFKSILGNNQLSKTDEIEITDLDGYLEIKGLGD